MSRRDRTPLPQDVARELEALDAALAGDPVDPDLTDLAALAVQVRDARPRPDAGAVRPAGRARRRGLRAAPHPAAGQLAPAAGRPARRGLDRARGDRRHRGARQRGGDDPAGLVATAPQPDADHDRRRRRHRTVAAQSESAAQGGASPATATAAPKAQPGPGAAVAPLAPSAGAPARSVERAAGLHLAALPGGLDDVASGIVRTTDALGGYVVSSSVESRGRGGRATFDLRVPSARLQTALARLSDLARGALTHARARSTSPGAWSRSAAGWTRSKADRRGVLRAARRCDDAGRQRAGARAHPRARRARSHGRRPPATRCAGARRSARSTSR